MTGYSQTTEDELISLVLDEVAEFSRSLERIEERIASAEGESRARWQVLNALSSGSATVSQIARRLGLTRQSVQRVADLLERERMVESKKNPDHKRAPLIAPTARGRRTLKKLEKRSRAFRSMVAKKTRKRRLADLRVRLRDVSDSVLEVGEQRGLIED